MKSILITGCAGFIGSHLAEYYLKKEFNVFGLDNFVTGSKSNVDLLQKFKNFKFYKHDISNSWTELELKLPQQSVVFHLASPAAVNQYQKFSLETMWANSVGLKNAIEFADSSRSKVVFSSTSEIYGSPDVSPQPETYWGEVNSFGERSCYDESKRFGEALIYSWNKKFGTKHGIVRIFNTYGSRMNNDDGRVVIQFLKSALRNENLVIFGDGKQTRSFCFIEDLIKGLDLYAQSDLVRPINLGQEEEMTINELAQLVLKITQSKSNIVFQDLPFDDPPKRRPDLALARQLLKYNPTTNLADGIKKILAERKSEYGL